MEEFTIDFESLIRTPGIIPFCTIIYLSVHGVHFIVIIVVYMSTSAHVRSSPSHGQ